MEILAFGIDCGSAEQGPQDYAVRVSINLPPDNVESYSRCRGLGVLHSADTLFTIGWNTQCGQQMTAAICHGLQGKGRAVSLGQQCWLDIRPHSVQCHTCIGFYSNQRPQPALA